ncbi:MAG: hypothetical protein ACRDHF_05780 [Tepidiformaceae bacterium]
MTRLAIVLTLLLTLSVFAAPAAAFAADGSAAPVEVAVDAQDDGGSPFTDAPGSGWSAVVIWTLVGLVVVAAVLGVLYFMKRQVGGFPDNPSWVAPITIMESKDFPDEGDFGDEAAAPSHH